MNINKDKILSHFKVDKKHKEEKSRWLWCEDISNLVGKTTIHISTLMKGMTTEQIKEFYNTAKTYSNPKIMFWKVWKDNKPK